MVLTRYKNRFLCVALFLTAGLGHAQADSAAFKKIQQRMDGCWRAGTWQFKYVQSSNRGYEYHSAVHASAPFFTLVYKDGHTYLQWIEMAGGEHVQEVVKATQRKLTLVNEDGKTGVYRRNKDCSGPGISKKKG